MKKVMVIIFALLLIASANLISATTEERECRSTCTQEKREDTRECRDNYKECRNDCTAQRRTCIDAAKTERTDCRNSCDSIEYRRERSSCKRSCSLTYSSDARECRSRECTSNCREENTACKEITKVTHSLCRNSCLPVGQAPFNFMVDEQTCIDGGGFYQRLCRGPFFGMSCSPIEYCQCGGFEEYTCPQDYTCVTDFGVSVGGRGNNLPEWRTHLGQDLGPIGLCGQPV